MDATTPETTLAAIGLEAILKGEPTFNGVQRHRAQTLARDIKRSVLQFLSRTEREPVDSLPPFDYKLASQLLNRSGTEDQAGALFKAIPAHDLGQAVANAATKIISQLQTMLPRRVRQEIQGAVVSPPSDMETARFARTWSVAMDPMIILRDLNEGSLSADMVQAFQNFWSGLYNITRAAVVAGVIDLKSRRPKWELESRRDRLLRTLIGLQEDHHDLALDFQTMYAQADGGNGGNQQAKPVSGSISRLDLGDDLLSTPGQKE